MTNWYVKDLSRLTNVSVQTLHHYDRIGLLTPSLRAANGYRLYSEKDLLKLQQIIALKYFGFDLTKIKEFLTQEGDVLAHFATQAEFLAEKARVLARASTALQDILATCGHNQSIQWETIIKLIEVYRMTQQLENSWEAKVFNSEQLKEYAEFELNLKKRYTPEQELESKKEWAAIVRDANSNTHLDPKSEKAIVIAKRCMDWVNNLYGVEHAELRETIWHKGFMTGDIDDNHGLTKEGVQWLDQAMDAYYRGRIYGLLRQVGKSDDAALRRDWNALMTEMYGHNAKGKAELIEAAMVDDNVNAAARAWLKK